MAWAQSSLKDASLYLIFIAGFEKVLVSKNALDGGHDFLHDFDVDPTCNLYSMPFFKLYKF